MLSLLPKNEAVLQIVIDPALREYAAKVIHSLRTPLTLLRLKIDDAGSRIEPDLQAELAAELDQLTYVIEQSILISQAERGLVHWRNQSFDLSEILGELFEDFRVLALEEGRELVCQFPSECFVDSDPAHLKRILHACLKNALQHGVGTIELSLVEDAKKARIVLMNSVAPVEVAGHVKDFGFGLRANEALLSRQEDVTCTLANSENDFAAVICIPLAVNKT